MTTIRQLPSNEPYNIMTAFTHQYKTVQEQIEAFLKHGTRTAAGIEEEKKRLSDVQFIELIKALMKKELIEIANLKMHWEKLYDESQETKRRTKEEKTPPLTVATPKPTIDIQDNASFLKQLEDLVRQLQNQIINTDQFIQETNELLNQIDTQKTILTQHVIQPALQSMHIGFEQNRPGYQAICYLAQGPVVLNSHCAQALQNLLNQDIGNLTTEAEFIKSLRAQSDLVFTQPAYQTLKVGPKSQEYQKFEVEEQEGMLDTIVKTVKECPVYDTLRKTLQCITNLDTLASTVKPWKEAAEKQLSVLTAEQNQVQNDLNKSSLGLPEFKYNPANKMKESENNEVNYRQFYDLGRKHLQAVRELAAQQIRDLTNSLGFIEEEEFANSKNRRPFQWPPKPDPIK